MNATHLTTAPPYGGRICRKRSPSPADRYELAWHDSANLLLAPAPGLLALAVGRFTAPAADEIGLRDTGRT